MLGYLENKELYCFDKKSIKSPTEIICVASSFLMYWAGLQQPEDKLNLEARAEL
jgi:hypothetical protein